MVDPDWLLDLEEASFAGVPFQLIGHGREGGKRGPDHEYPDRDTGANEDLGRRLVRFSFDAFVIGDDYHIQAQNLIAALDAGRGELIHPRWGAWQVICRQYSESESNAAQGMATFSLSFVEASGELGVTVIVAADAATKAAADALKLAAAAAFADAFAVTGFSGAVSDRALSDLAGRVDQLLVTVQGPISGVLVDSDGFFAAVETLEADAIALVSDPAELASTLQTALAAIGDLGALSSLTRARPASLTGDLAVLPVDPGEAQILLNADAFSALMQRSALAERSALAVDAGFSTFDDATAERDELAELIEADELLPSSFDEFDQLVELRTRLVIELTDQAASLARLRTVTLSTVTSALALAWDLYGDATRADEIVERNGIAHPSFIPPGVYTVLSE
jgi:prophage DNA circulation protein